MSENNSIVHNIMCFMIILLWVYVTIWIGVMIRKPPDYLLDGGILSLLWAMSSGGFMISVLIDIGVISGPLLSDKEVSNEL